jgi:hypothetical protein
MISAANDACGNCAPAQIRVTRQASAGRQAFATREPQRARPQHAAPAMPQTPAVS